MSVTHDFYGKDVAEAVAKASNELAMDHDQLDIEILATGSAGFFGFGRKDAHIRVSVKEKQEVNPKDPFGVSGLFAESMAAVKDDPVKGSGKKRQEISRQKKTGDREQEIATLVSSEESEVSQHTISLLEKELLNIVKLMGFPSRVETTVSGRNVEMTLHGKYESQLIGEEGQVLDSLQYLLRKIAGRKCSEQLRLNLDVGDYRTCRLVEVKARASALAEKVQQDGKTRAIAALSPSERREIHLLLQGEQEIRSRSVGEGMFKKILIYKPGKSRRKKGKSTQNRKRVSRSVQESGSTNK